MWKRNDNDMEDEKMQINHENPIRYKKANKTMKQRG